MLIAENESVIDYVERYIIVKHQPPPVRTLIGSCFSDDLISGTTYTEKYNYRVLMDIILYAETNVTLVMRRMGHLYDNLYDLVQPEFRRDRTEKVLSDRSRRALPSALFGQRRILLRRFRPERRFGHVRSAVSQSFRKTRDQHGIVGSPTALGDREELSLCAQRSPTDRFEQTLSTFATLCSSITVQITSATWSSTRSIS